MNSVWPFTIYYSCYAFQQTTSVKFWLQRRKSTTFARCNHPNAKIPSMIYTIIYCSGRHGHLLRNISNRYCHTSFCLILHGLPDRLKVHGKRPNVTKEIQSYYDVDNPPQNFGIACCYTSIRCLVSAGTKHNVAMFCVYWKIWKFWERMLIILFRWSWYVLSIKNFMEA